MKIAAAKQSTVKTEVLRRPEDGFGAGDRRFMRGLQIRGIEPTRAGCVGTGLAEPSITSR